MRCRFLSTSNPVLIPRNSARVPSRMPLLMDRPAHRPLARMSKESARQWLTVTVLSSQDTAGGGTGNDGDGNDEGLRPSEHAAVKSNPNAVTNNPANRHGRQRTATVSILGREHS